MSRLAVPSHYVARFFESLKVRFDGELFPAVASPDVLNVVGLVVVVVELVD